MSHRASSRKRDSESYSDGDDMPPPPPRKKSTRASNRVRDDDRDSQADEWSTPRDFEDRIMESPFLEYLKIVHRELTVPFKKWMLQVLSSDIRRGRFNDVKRDVGIIDEWFALYPQPGSVSEQRALEKVQEKWQELKRQLEPPSWSLRDLSVLHGQNALAPSQAAKAPKLRLQQETHPMDIGRGMARLGPPISLFHPIFSQFQTLLKTPAETGIDTKDGVLAYQLIVASAEFYETETDRVDAIRGLLNGLLERNIGRLDNPEAMQCDPDGLSYALSSPARIHVSKAPPVLIMEVKNEIGEGGSDPDFQAVLVFRKIVSHGQYAMARKASCSPCFLLSVAGPRLAIYGGIHTDTFIAQPLARPMYLFGDPDPCTQADEVARFFRALRTCLRELDEFYTNLNFGVENPHATHPCHQKIGQVMLEYSGENLLAEHSLGRAMFKAKMKQPNEESATSVLVKFTPRYGEQAHRVLAEQGLAPTMHCCEVLKNGWKAVVMDEISGTNLTKMRGPAPFPQRILQDVQKAIKLLHHEGFVFGDLRPGNIMVYDSDVGDGQLEKRAMLVDFDWAGKAQLYPYSLNSSVEWPEGVQPGGPMEQSHDLEMLNRLVSALSSDHPPPAEAAC